MIRTTGYLIFTASALLTLTGCTPPPTEPASEAAVAPPLQQAFRSMKRVGTDCGVEFAAEPPPGFAERAGKARKPLPEPVAGMLAIGAERSPVETNEALVSPGYVLIEPGSVKESFIINNTGDVLATLTGDYFASLSQVDDEGNRMVSANAWSDEFADGGGFRGCLEEYAANGDLLWRLNLNTDEYVHHHDAVKMPNGNVLAIVWEQVSTAEAISQGRNPGIVAENGNFWYDGIIEVNPYTLEIVWEWSARHHMIQEFDAGEANYGVVADHPELMDINVHRPNRDGTVSADWTHANAMDYNPERDQIVWSSNYHSEIFVIDHSTTPREAAGHSGGRYGKGGDILYRWGNPANYGRGDADVRQLYYQHDVQWIKPGLPGAGNILAFNNGDSKVRSYSTVVEIDTGIGEDGAYSIADGAPYGPETPAWEYDPPEGEQFFSFFISGAQRLPNGNTLVTQGAGAKLREVTSDGEIVWEYAYTDELDGPHMLFRANRYPADHLGIQKILQAAAVDDT